jgi:hypothetical protein
MKLLYQPNRKLIPFQRGEQIGWGLVRLGARPGIVFSVDPHKQKRGVIDKPRLCCVMCCSLVVDERDEFLRRLRCLDDTRSFIVRQWNLERALNAAIAKLANGAGKDTGDAVFALVQH